MFEDYIYHKYVSLGLKICLRRLYVGLIEYTENVPRLLLYRYVFTYGCAHACIRISNQSLRNVFIA